MTYNVFSGTLNLTQSIILTVRYAFPVISYHVDMPYSVNICKLLHCNYSVSEVTTLWCYRNNYVYYCYYFY